MWFPVAPGSKPLPFPSAVSSLDWVDNPFDQPDDAVGEVWNTPRNFQMFRFIPGTGRDHYCGDEVDFAGNATASSGVQYDINGLPKCCPYPNPTSGGAEVGGAAVVNVIYPCVVTSGEQVTSGIQFADISTELTATQGFSIPRTLVITEAEFEFTTNEGDEPISVSMYLGSGPFVQDVGPFNLELDSTLIAEAIGEDWWLCKGSLNHTLAPGNWWVTLAVAATAGDDFVAWTINGGPGPAYYASELDPVSGFYMCLHGYLEGSWEYTATGGVEVGGSAMAVRIVQVDGSGGVEVGGSAIAEIPIVADGTGGVEVGGSATASLALVADGTGGVEIGGSATASLALVADGTGGVEIGGSATASLALVADGTGSVEIGGSATADLPPHLRDFANYTNGSTSHAIVTLNLPTRVAGDLLVMIGYSDQAVSNVPSTGWTVVNHYVNPSAGQMVIWERTATNTTADNCLVTNSGLGDFTATIYAFNNASSAYNTTSANINNSTSKIAPILMASGESISICFWAWQDNTESSQVPTILIPAGLTGTGNTTATIYGQGSNSGYARLPSGTNLGSYDATESGLSAPWGLVVTVLVH